MKATSLKSSLTWTIQQTGAELLRVGEGDTRAFLIANTLDSMGLRALATAAVEAADWLDESHAEARPEIAR
jgi:hypothetical protein